MTPTINYQLLKEQDVIQTTCDLTEELKEINTKKLKEGFRESRQEYASVLTTQDLSEWLEKTGVQQSQPAVVVNKPGNKQHGYAADKKDWKLPPFFESKVAYSHGYSLISIIQEVCKKGAYIYYDHDRNETSLGINKELQRFRDYARTYVKDTGELYKLSEYVNESSTKIEAFLEAYFSGEYKFEAFGVNKALQIGRNNPVGGDYRILSINHALEEIDYYKKSINIATVEDILLHLFGIQQCFFDLY